MVEMLLKKSYSEYHAEESGSYLSGFTNDIAQMEQLGWEPLFGMFGVLAQIVSSLIALFYLHWSLLVVSIIFGILMVLLPRIFNQKLENAGNICSRLQAKQSANLRSFWRDTMFFGLLEKKIEWFAEQKRQMSKWKPQGII